MINASRNYRLFKIAHTTPALSVRLRVHGQEVEVVQLSDARTSFAEHLAYLWSVLVNDEEWILTKIGLVTLKKSGLILEEGVGFDLRGSCAERRKPLAAWLSKAARRRSQRRVLTS